VFAARHVGTVRIALRVPTAYCCHMDTVDTWADRELPVLRVLVEKLDNPDTFNVHINELPQATGLDMADVQRALRALSTASPAYFEWAGFEEATYPIAITAVTERALRAVGQWPASDHAADAIVAALNEAADTEPDEEKRSGLRKAAAFLGGAGKDVLYRVVTQVSSQEVTQHIPHHL
jgi:hypothetical protein